MAAEQSNTSAAPRKCLFKWTDEMTFRFIALRFEHDSLFTGHRNASTDGYVEIIKTMALEGRVTPAQCKKKWENLKRKYKELSSQKRTGSGTDQGEVTAASWTFMEAMHEAIGHRPSNSPVSLYSSGPTSVVSQQEENQESTASTPGSGAESSVSSSPGTEVSESSSQCTVAESSVSSPKTSPVGPSKKPGKRMRNEREAEHFREWCENMDKRQREEDEHDRAWLSQSQSQMDKMLQLFGRLVDHLTK